MIKKLNKSFTSEMCDFIWICIYNVSWIENLEKSDVLQVNEHLFVKSLLQTITIYSKFEKNCGCKLNFWMFVWLCMARNKGVQNCFINSTLSAPKDG